MNELFLLTITNYHWSAGHRVFISVDIMVWSAKVQQPLLNWRPVTSNLIIMIALLATSSAGRQFLISLPSNRH